MKQLQPEDSFKISVLSAQEHDISLDKVVIVYGDAEGLAEYSRGAKLETAAGDIIEGETVTLDNVAVNEDARRAGIGTKLLARAIEEAREEDFSYLRTFLINPLSVKVIERTLREGVFENRAYRSFHLGELYDMPTAEMLVSNQTISPEQAMDEVGQSPRVECAIEL